MKTLINTITAIILTIFVQGCMYAHPIDNTISKSGINKNAVSVSVKDVKTGKTVYSLNSQQPKNPASTLKLITLKASLDTLGKDYEFSTKLYKNTDNELYLKLGADPFLKSSDLNNIFEIAKEKKIITPKAVYIDDFIFDDVEWGEGWQWDDDLNPLMPKFSSYNLDQNLLQISVIPTRLGASAEIVTRKFYPITFMNLAVTEKENNLSITRNNNISPDIINVSGNVNKVNKFSIPVNNPKRYFKLRLDEAIKSSKIDYYGKFPHKKTPVKNIYLVSEVNHPISDTVEPVLKNSDNFIAETVFKAAGAKYVNNTGSLENSQKMLNNYFEKININTDNIRVVDGSGVSKNNLVTADFMSEFLVKISQYEDFRNLMATSGEGTLGQRMLYFKDNLRAKTGTLSDVSTIAGYITSRRGKTYAFDIMINDPKSKSSEKKSLEEYIIRDIFSFL